VHNTTNNRQQAAHTYAVIPPRPPASSSFKLLGECNRSTLHGGTGSLQHGDSFFKVKLTPSLFYLQLFYRLLTGALASKKVSFIVNYRVF